MEMISQTISHRTIPEKLVEHSMITTGPNTE
jgi:hypothetical protein